MIIYTFIVYPFKLVNMLAFSIFIDLTNYALAVFYPGTHNRKVESKRKSIHFLRKFSCKVLSIL
jgi:hypothetical protein